MNAKEADGIIKQALRNAEEQGKLGVVAEVTGIAGGVKTLREIIGSKDDLSIMDRGMLGMHLGLHMIL